MDAQQQLFGLMAVAEEQQKAVQAAVDGLAEDRRQWAKSVGHVAERIAANVSDASETAQQRSDDAIERFRRTWSTVIWKTVVAAIITVSALSALVVWAQRWHIGELIERRAALQDEVATLERQAAVYAKKGGRIVFSTCGDDGRLCIEIASNQGFNATAKGSYVSNDGNKSFVIPKGY